MAGALKRAIGERVMQPDGPPASHSRKRRLLRALLGAALGSITLLVVGQAYAAWSGGGCALLCNPPVALGYGALIGALFAAG
jgi:hypothetical protein